MMQMGFTKMDMPPKLGAENKSSGKGERPVRIYNTGYGNTGG